MSRCDCEFFECLSRDKTINYYHSINSVHQVLNAVQKAATVVKLSLEEKLRKVLHKLQIDGL